MSNSWEYRVIKKKGPNGAQSFHIHEVHYDGNERIRNWSIDSIRPMGENMTELKNDLTAMKKACSLPPIHESDLQNGLKRKQTI